MSSLGPLVLVEIEGLKPLRDKNPHVCWGSLRRFYCCYGASAVHLFYVFPCAISYAAVCCWCERPS